MIFGLQKAKPHFPNVQTYMSLAQFRCPNPKNRSWKNNLKGFESPYLKLKTLPSSCTKAHVVDSVFMSK